MQRCKLSCPEGANRSRGSPPWRAHLRLSALDSSSTSSCLTRLSSSRLTGVISLGRLSSTLLTRLDTAVSSASNRPAL